VDLLGVQFNKYGGSFVVEIGSCPLEGVRIWGGRLVAAEKARYFDLPWELRLRLGSKPGRVNRDHWFKFRKGFLVYWFSYDSVARSVLPFLDNQAEPYWESNDKKRSA
jgi:hypothetical protein